MYVRPSAQRTKQVLPLPWVMLYTCEPTCSSPFCSTLLTTERTALHSSQYTGSPVCMLLGAVSWRNDTSTIFVSARLQRLPREAALALSTSSRPPEDNNTAGQSSQLQKKKQILHICNCTAVRSDKLPEIVTMRFLTLQVVRNLIVFFTEIQAPNLIFRFNNHIIYLYI